MQLRKHIAQKIYFFMQYSTFIALYREDALYPCKEKAQQDAAQFDRGLRKNSS